jgi:hypothetical protein
MKIYEKIVTYCADQLADGFMWLGGTSIAAIFLALIYNGFIWLKDGYWPEISLNKLTSDFFTLPENITGWIGLDKLFGFLFENFFNGPLSLTLVYSGIIFFILSFLAGAYGSDPDDIE